MNIENGGDPSHLCWFFQGQGREHRASAVPALIMRIAIGAAKGLGGGAITGAIGGVFAGGPFGAAIGAGILGISGAFLGAIAEI